MILRASVFLCCLLFATSANADEYADVSLINFLHTLIRFQALDIMNDDALLDDYAIISDCDLVENFYENDFRWGQVRKLMRDSIKMNESNYPTQYHYDRKLRLARYDFKNKNFRFTDDTAIRSVNTFNFSLKPESSGCNGHELHHLPTVYNVVVGTPVSINGLPFSENEAKTLLSQLESEGNTDRTIYVRFNMTIAFIDPLKKSKSNSFGLYLQGSNTSAQPVRMDARMDSIEFFEDPEHTKKLYGYTP